MKKTRKILFKSFKYVFIFLALLVVLLSIPAVQTRLAKVVTKKINEDFGTDILVKKVDLSFLGSVILKGIQIRDHHKDTLIFVDKLTTSLIDAKKILDNKLNFKNMELENVYFHMKTYKGETEDNISVFVDSFEDDKPKQDKSNPFLLKTKNIHIKGLNFKITDENKSENPEFLAQNVSGQLLDFKILGPDVSSKIRGLKMNLNRKIRITNFDTDFYYTLTGMRFKKTSLKTEKSDLKADIQFSYKRRELKYFSDKVKIKAQIKKSSISIKDLHKFYRELRGEDLVHLTANVEGTLNNFRAVNVRLHSKKGIKIDGDIKFVNSANVKRGFILDGNFQNITANFKQLESLLPNLMGEKTSPEFYRLGKIDLSGKINLNKKQLNADIIGNTSIGTFISNLQFTDIKNLDSIKYRGEINLKNFNIGRFANDPLLGKISLKSEVNGSGFRLESINTTAIGNISELEFNNYTYKNIFLNGQIKNKLFNGNLKVDEQNLKMEFKGLADFSSQIDKFNFKATVDKANLLETNLFTRDSISNLKGNIIFNIQGNSLDNVLGKIAFENLEYTNEKQKYTFKKFEITSSLKDSIKTIKINSKDIINGSLSGKFKFTELYPVVQNALGSVYANYNPYKVEAHQFLNFDFIIHNQIIDVLFPEVVIEENTKIRGNISSDKNSLKLVFSCPKLKVYDNTIDAVLLRMNNKNTLYNTHLTADKIVTKYYKVSKFNLLNRTQNDTLYFKSIFKGGEKTSESYNLDFFYTINEDKKSVLGIQKSTFNFKDKLWEINPKNDIKNNKVTFDIKSKIFDFNLFTLASKGEKVQFKGIVKDSTYKDLSINFYKVKLADFTPSIDSMSLKGKLNGTLHFKQQDGTYNPKANLSVKDFEVNSYPQGDLSLEMQGDHSYKKYNVSLNLKNKYSKSISAEGNVDFSTDNHTINLTTVINNFQLNAFSPLGKDVLSKLRGKASGKFQLTGQLKNPTMNGFLTLDDAGLKFPYLNVDFNLEGNTKIILKDQSFLFNDLVIKDSKYATEGTLEGSISYQNLESWFFNLSINSQNMLVLDTQETEESLYYGTGFIKGNARITGLANGLTIDVNATTRPNTKFVIPLNDIKTIDNYRLIHFKSADKTTTQKEKSVAPVKGLDLNINLDITKDAEAQIVIDKSSGSELKGSGEGNLQIAINTRGKFNMFGDFTVDRGVYNFKYAGIINKPFEVQKGGVISWSGDPYQANLDLTAVYKTKANPAVLLENFSTNRKIPVNLYTKITGGLFNSKQEFDILIPNANSIISSELAFKLNDNDSNSKMRQFFSLLVTGSFFNQNNLGASAAALAGGTGSDLISNVLSDVLNTQDGKFKLGVGYTQGDRSDIANLNTDNQVDVSVSTQVSDRVIVNGKVGLPVGSRTQTNVVGEVKLEVLLNDKGNFRGVVFNRQNQVQYSSEEEGYTQGVGLSYQVHFNTLSELLKKVGLKKKSKIKKTKKIIKKDSVLTPNKKLINFKK